ncbi:hypothetical protein CYLTODRAFT_420272 [Cylindrobasidium torrendii FP15055 ss-10]|uniref:Uncharacterized protein n=1 Tax=Cylindrobasidium torrendii FP15055 ss-10 TaxID=1314674 RepID=A0A0D7BHY4_9AGAR|nr:hypothetical protein CYLTODRAFT_420272 [Cylindrobasidium torrendii FP15055 ss-10]
MAQTKLRQVPCLKLLRLSRPAYKASFHSRTVPFVFPFDFSAVVTKPIAIVQPFSAMLDQESIESTSASTSESGGHDQASFSPKSTSDCDSGYSSSPPSPQLQPRHRQDQTESSSEPERIPSVLEHTEPVLERIHPSPLCASSPSPSLQHHHPNHIPPPPSISTSTPPPPRRPRRKQVIITQSIEHLAAEYSAKRVRYREPPPPCPVLPSGKYALMPDVAKSAGYPYVNSAGISTLGTPTTPDGYSTRYYSRSEGHMGTLEEHTRPESPALRVQHRRDTNTSLQELGNSQSCVAEKRRPRGLTKRLWHGLLGRLRR